MDDVDKMTQEILDGFGSPSKMMRRDRGETPKKVPVKAAYSNQRKEKIDIVAKITLGKIISRDFFLKQKTNFKLILSDIQLS